jgi:hypothetical protein
MTEFKEAIPAAGGKIEFLYQPNGQIGIRISGSSPQAMYMVAVSMDGRRLLSEIPVVGLGQVAV